MKKLFFILFTAALIAVSTNVASAATVTPGWDAAADLSIASRFRNVQDLNAQSLDGWELALGAVSGFPTGADNVDFGYNPHWGNSNHFEIAYTKSDNQVSVSMDVDPSTSNGFEYSLTYDNFTPSSLNYIQFEVVSRDTTGSVWLTDLKLNDEDLGSYGSSNPNDGWHTWNITGEDWTNGFTIMGTMNIDGPFAKLNSEQNKIDFKFGSAPFAVPLPAAFWLLGPGLLGMVCLRSRSTTSSNPS
ncbi:MAG: VPLPA-CTERM sorting domain-containing protein [Pseudomonadota bacterium]